VSNVGGNHVDRFILRIDEQIFEPGSLHLRDKLGHALLMPVKALSRFTSR